MKNVMMFLVVISLFACAHQSSPIIDTKGVDMMQYANDLNE